MEIHKNDFLFIPGTTDEIPPDEYLKTETFVNMAKALAQTTDRFVYIIDYAKRNFLYESINMAYLLGEPANNVDFFDYKMYFNHIPANEQHKFIEINMAASAMFARMPIKERTMHTITYDFHLMMKKRQRLVNHHLTPLALTESGRMWLALCTIGLSAMQTAGHAIIKKAGSNIYHEYSLDRHEWIEKEMGRLRDIERSILILSAQGFTMNDIADKLCKSVDTIKKYRKGLFKKFGVKNITAALTYATNYKML